MTNMYKIYIMKTCLTNTHTSASSKHTTMYEYFSCMKGYFATYLL